MSILDIVKLIKELTSKENIYPLKFPDYIKGTGIKLELLSSTDLGAGVQELDIQLVIKDIHPQKAESTAREIVSSVNVTNKLLLNDTVQIILCKCLTPQPFYLGESEVGEYVFSIDFRALVNRLEDTEEENK